MSIYRSAHRGHQSSFHSGSFVSSVSISPEALSRISRAVTLLPRDSLGSRPQHPCRTKIADAVGAVAFAGNSPNCSVQITAKAISIEPDLQHSTPARCTGVLRHPVKSTRGLASIGSLCMYRLKVRAQFDGVPYRSRPVAF